MTNQDIDLFFEKVGLRRQVEKQIREPTWIWMLYAGGFPIMIQTQATANRMRIVAYIAEQSEIDTQQMIDMLEANYHSALDARFALADGYVVSAFLHPFKELDGNQFVLGMYQVVNCAETYGTHFSGGTMVFGGKKEPRDSNDFDLDHDLNQDLGHDPDLEPIGDMEEGAVNFLGELVRKFRDD